ncbi:unnamed protein product, partial [Musa acuminata subsp. burmannicoides]
SIEALHRSSSPSLFSVISDSPLSSFPSSSPYIFSLSLSSCIGLSSLRFIKFLSSNSLKSSLHISQEAQYAAGPQCQ